MATTTIVTGFTIAPGDVDDAVEDDEALTTEEELCQLILTRLRQRCPRAALGAAADLVNHIARTHDLAGGAYL